MVLAFFVALDKPVVLAGGLLRVPLTRLMFVPNLHTHNTGCTRLSNMCMYLPGKRKNKKK